MTTTKDRKATIFSTKTQNKLYFNVFLKPTLFVCMFDACNNCLYWISEVVI